MNMPVTAELSMKDSKGSVLAMEQTSSKRKYFVKKKKSVKKQKMEARYPDFHFQLLRTLLS